MDEKAAYASRTAVEVFVAAPSCEVNVPVVQLQRHVAGCVSKIPSNDYAPFLRVGSDGRNVEKLTGVELDTW